MSEPSFWDWYWFKVGLQPYQTEFLLPLRFDSSHNSVWYDYQPTMIQYKSQHKWGWLPIWVVRKVRFWGLYSVRFAKYDFATRCKSVTCATLLNTRIFASDFRFGEFHAILRGVFVKKIHILHASKDYSGLLKKAALIAMPNFSMLQKYDGVCKWEKTFCWLKFKNLW